MALIYDSRFRAIDSNGDPLVGATLTINDANTTTLASIYRDNALSTPMTNPTSGADVSDAGGWFGQIFAAEGSLFDITLKNSAGVTVKTYVDVSPLGDGSSTFSRDFGNSRVQIRGSGGVARVEAGDPTGDDIGGQLALSGWNASQADEVTIDAVDTVLTGDLDVGGIITEDGNKLPGIVASTGSFTGVTSVTIALTKVPSTVRAWEVELFDLVASTNGAMTMQFSFDNNATINTTANYLTRNIRNTNAGVAQDYGAAATSCTLFATYFGNGSVDGLVRLRLLTPLTTGITKYSGEGIDPLVGGGTDQVIMSGYFNSVTTPVTHVKISIAAGNITGKYRVVPLRGYGEA